MDKLLYEFLLALLNEQNTGPDSWAVFFATAMIDGEAQHVVSVGTPTKEYGFPQLAMDGGDARPTADKNALREAVTYNLNVWHGNTQIDLMKGSEVAEQLAQCIHQKVTFNGLYIQVIERRGLEDKDKTKARSLVKVEVIRVR